MTPLIGPESQSEGHGEYGERVYAIAMEIKIVILYFGSVVEKKKTLLQPELMRIVCSCFVAEIVCKFMLNETFQREN